MRVELTEQPPCGIIARHFSQWFPSVIFRIQRMSAITCKQPFSIRPAAEADEPFLYALYASTRAEELAAWGWTSAQQERFLQLQFRAQQQHYAAYPDTVHWIIEQQSPSSPAQQLRQPLGRLLLSFLPDEIRLVDVALLPDYRGQGLGAALVGWVQAQASAEGKAVRLHVTPDNPARRLYERLGFTLLEDRQSHLLLEWCAPKPTAIERNHRTHAG
jgi:ribosomal protein S18 acetylase RimI-like enzyme